MVLPSPSPEIPIYQIGCFLNNRPNFLQQHLAGYRHYRRPIGCTCEITYSKSHSPTGTTAIQHSLK